MRPDMHEVIIERPRRGHAERYPRRRVANLTRPRDRESDPPTREPMGRFYGDKGLNENLAPLVRYLRSNLGRPWSKVRSEMMAHIQVGSAVQKHVMDHVRGYICERVVPDGAGGFIGHGEDGPERPWFYVHPVTGHLLERVRAPRKRASRARAEAQRPDVRVLSSTRQLRRIDGIWYDVELAPIPQRYGPHATTEVVWDVVARVDPTKFTRYRALRGEAMAFEWREHLYARAKRQLSRREIRTLLGGAR